MKILEFINNLSKELPLSLALPDDQVGFQLFHYNNELTKICVCYEINDEILDIICKINPELLIVFHPLIYKPIKNIDLSDRVGRALIRLIKNDIALYVLHTAFDSYIHGTSYLLAKEIGLLDIEPLDVNIDNSKYGMGIIGNWVNGGDIEYFVNVLHEKNGFKFIRYTKNYVSEIKKVAILGGSGISYYKKAIIKGADVFITADVKYHDFVASIDGIGIIDLGHNESEKFVSIGMKNLIDKLNDNSFEVNMIQTDTNPIRYKN